MSGHKVVVVGAGLAGAHVAQHLRQDGFEGEVTLVGSEPDLPYDRTKLSKDYLMGKLDHDDITLHDAAWYQDHDISLLTGETVESVHTAARQVRLASGTTLAYDHLVLATGADSRRLRLPGADLPGVLTLRDRRESDLLRETFARGGRLAVIGAGWIGLEAAAAAREAGMEVSVVAPEAQPLAAVLGERIGGLFADLHRRNGVELRMGTGVQGILERDGRAAGLHTDAGDVSADAVLLAVGAVPRIGLAEQIGLAVDNGVLTDAQLRTSDRRILAVGDIANAENTLLGHRLRREHWDTALRHGALAARTIMGLPGAYDWQPYFYTDQYDFSMEYVGSGAASDETIIRGSVESGEYIVFWRRDGIVTAAMNVNTWDVNDTLRRMVGHRGDSVLLADTSIALDVLVPGGPAS